MWIVGLNRPYYPSVEFYLDEVEAQQEYKKLLKEDEEDGHHSVKVFIAKVDKVEDIFTSF